MNWNLIITGIVPLILFVVVEIKYGMKAGIITAIVVGILLAIWFFIQSGEIDEMMVVEIIFLILLGFISLKLQNSRFFKFQPTIVGIAFVLYLGYLEIFAEPVMLHMRPLMIKMQPDMESALMTEPMTNFLTMLSHHLIPLFLLHAVVVGYFALRPSNVPWLVSRLAIYPALILLAITDRFLFF